MIAGSCCFVIYLYHSSCKLYSDKSALNMGPDNIYYVLKLAIGPSSAKNFCTHFGSPHPPLPCTVGSHHILVINNISTHVRAHTHARAH